MVWIGGEAMPPKCPECYTFDSRTVKESKRGIRGQRDAKQPMSKIEQHQHVCALETSTARHNRAELEPVSFIIPARNEASTIGAVIDACYETAHILRAYCEVIVVSDGSGDATVTHARHHR